MKLSILFLILFFTSINSFSKNDSLYVAFWNLENLFDAEDDPIKDDTEFLPSGDKEWTADRLEKKYYNLARVIRSMNNNKGPDVLGVCEVEHQYLLDSLTAKYLPDMNYKSAHVEAPDNRGIDNGLIFNKDKFTLLNIISDTVNLDDGYPTRLILNVNLLTKDLDTLRFFVNHWPSRRGGELESEVNRIRAAEVLRKRIDSYFSLNSYSKIIVMGDFNDEPVNTSLLETLKAYPLTCDSIPQGDVFSVEKKLFNLSYSSFADGEGSYKYKDNWNMLDQIIISGSMLTGKNYNYYCGSFSVYKPDFILTKTGSFAGTPFPTYGGKRYLGGYSDHFPVVSIFIKQK